MSIEIPDSASQIDNKAKTDVQRELTGSNPFAKNHWLAAMITAFSNRVFDFYKQLLNGINAVFPDTAFGDYLSRWMVIFKISQIAASTSTGNVVATGTDTTEIVIGTKVANANGDLYSSTATVNIAESTTDIDTLTRSGQIATATFLQPHLLASGVVATIADAVETEYNGAFTITVISDTQFQYTLVGSPTTPATGTITSTATTASVPIESDETGSTLNLDNGEEVTLSSPIAGVDNTLTADFGAVGGGGAQESLDDAQVRMVQRIQNPVAHFNAGDIRALAKTLNGVTRVFVQTPSTKTTSVPVNLTRLDDGTDDNVVALATIQSGTFSFFSGQTITITASDKPDYNIADTNCIITTSTTLIYSVGASTEDPIGSQATITGSDIPLGTVRVYFMRDNDFDNAGERDPIPTASEVNALKDLLLTILPGNTSENDLVVAAPDGIEIDFPFNTITPDTAGMRTGIKNALEQLMFDRTSVGRTLEEDDYRAAITNAFDQDSGEYIQSYDLTLTGDQAMLSGQIPILGEITYL